jgi:CRP/FNR family transcriptional regulator, cyclic AMP receptor protein
MDQDLLSNNPLFAKLNEEQLAELAGLLKEQRVEAQQPVFWIGDEGADFYVLQVGRCAVCYPDEMGHEVTIAVLKPGDFFGEISLLDGGPRTATIRAEEDVILYSLSRHDFLEFLKRHPTAAIHILTILGQRQREMLQKMRGLKNVNEVAEQRMSMWFRVADKIAAVAASGTFLGLHVLWFVVWILPNVFPGMIGKAEGWDPFPFGLLTMVVSLEAIILSIIIMVSQNRAGEKDRLRADLDYQVNLKAHMEVMQLHRKLDRVEQAVTALSERAAADTGPTSATVQMLGLSGSDDKRGA